MKTEAPHEHEHADVSVAPIVMFGLALVVIVVSSLFGLAGLFRFLSHEAPVGPPPSPMAQHQLPPAPRLEIHTTKDLDALRKAEDAAINSYGWVDRDAGRVRIPISRAIDLIAERGLPVRNPEARK
jgi:hypothetical protein